VIFGWAKSPGLPTVSSCEMKTRVLVQILPAGRKAPVQRGLRAWAGGRGKIVWPSFDRRSGRGWSAGSPTCRAWMAGPARAGTAAAWGLGPYRLLLRCGRERLSGRRCRRRGQEQISACRRPAGSARRAVNLGISDGKEKVYGSIP